MIRTSLSEVKNRDSVKKMMTDKKRVSLGGVVSITSNQKPLYVVDGIVAKDDAPNITAENIESLTVLKSAEATAIYGNMAANGVIIIATKQAKTIKGKVTDEEGNPVSFASIQIKGSKNGVAADAEGAFAIKPDKKQDTIIISSVGYQTESFNISSSKNYNFVLKPSNITLGGEVVITTSCSRRLGGLTMGYTVVQKKTIIDTVKSILNIQKPSLNIYPNPVNRGNNITLSLKLKKQGVYSVQIINSDGELLKEQKINIPAKEFNQTIATDSRWAAGTYFIKIIDEKNNAVSTQRFIAQ
jgi:TonB-dependent SusC/RagA subfamily outer membrane receptor